MGLGTVAVFSTRGPDGSYTSAAITQCLTREILVEPHTDSTGRNEVASRIVISFSGQLTSADVPTSATTTASPVGSDPGTAYSSTIFGVGVGHRFESFMELASRMSSVDLSEFKYIISSSVIVHAASYPDNISSGGSMPTNGVVSSFGVASSPQPAMSGTPKMTIKAKKIAGELSIWVDVEVEVIVKLCSVEAVTNGDDYRRNIKSLRWWYSDDIDAKTWLTRRLFRGRLELWNKAINPQLMRMLVLPPISYGYRRDSIRLNESEDGLSLDFEVVDTETRANPPLPACDWEGDVKVSFPKLFAGPVTVSMDCSLTGPPHINKIVLADTLVKVLDAKLDWFNRVVSDNRSVYTMSFDISESITKNEVNGNVVLQFIPISDEEMLSSTYGASLTAIVGNIFGNNMSYNPSRVLNFAGGSGAPDPSIPPYSIEFGHSRGIRGYDPASPTWAYPSPTSTRGILYNALLSTHCGRHYTPQEAAYVQNAYGEPPSKAPDKKPDPPKNPEVPPGEDPGAEDRKVLTKLDPDTSSPYMMYRISTTHSQDMGLSIAATNNSYFDNEGGNTYGTTFVSQTRTPTNRVSIRMESSRLNEWPNFPNELNWKDEETGIYYFCEGFNIEANGVSPSVTGDKLLYSGIANVTYSTSRPIKYDEKVRVACAPFISSSSSDSTVQASMKYIDCGYRKPGNRFVAGDTEDICSSTPEEPPIPPEDPPTPEI